MVSRHISIDEEYFDRIKHYIEKHNGNLGAAFREIINQVEINNSHTNIDASLSDWIFNEAEGRLVPDSLLDEIIDPGLINSMKKLDEYLNNRFNKLWNVNINLEVDSDVLPSYILVDIRGSSSKINVVAGILSKYLIRHSYERSPLGIKTVTTFDESIRIEFCMMNKEKSLKSLCTFFGYTDEILKIINDKPIFWKTVIETHLMNNYDMVTIHRNHFEELLANDMSIGLGEITIETLTKRAIQDIPLEELLYLIKYVYENSRIVDKIEIDRHDIILYHSYRKQKAIDKLKEVLVALLENSGHLYDAKSTSNMIILRYIPDMGIKIDQIIDNLKTSKDGLDQELTMLMICANGLKDMPDMSSLSSLGRDFGKSLIHEYEKENGNQWNIEKFKKFLEEIDSKLHRTSEWKLENGKILYTVKNCDIVKCEDNSHICHIIREMFKGALSYAFGDNARLEIKKLLSHGDNSCEVIVRTK